MHKADEKSPNKWLSDSAIEERLARKEGWTSDDKRRIIIAFIFSVVAIVLGFIFPDKMFGYGVFAGIIAGVLIMSLTFIFIVWDREDRCKVDRAIIYGRSVKQ